MATNSGQFQPGDPRAGRPVGAVNKLNAKVKEAIEEAFERVGGADYLEKLAWTDKPVFCALLGKLLPKDVNVDIGQKLSDILDGFAKKGKPE
jgi:hypothetical protein